MSLVTDALKVLRDQAVKELTAKAVAAAVARWGVLANPVLNPIVVFVCRIVIEFVLDEGETLAFYGYTRYMVNQQKDAVYEALTKNKEEMSDATKLAVINRARELIKLRT